MARQWTEEQRQAARERAAARGGVGKKAPVMEPGEILRPDGSRQRPSDGAAVLNRSEMFAARMKAALPLTTNDDMPMDAEERQVADSTSIEHTSSGLVRMYKKTHYGAWMPLKVSRNSVVECLQAGYLDHCPDCGGYCGDDVNDCPGRPKMTYIPCPVCGKRFYDTALPPQKQDAADAFALPGAYANSTPEMRMQAQANDHLIWYHEQTAKMYGLIRPPVALQ